MSLAERLASVFVGLALLAGVLGVFADALVGYHDLPTWRARCAAAWADFRRGLDA